jgi:homoserine O-acetyltransferase
MSLTARLLAAVCLATAPAAVCAQSFPAPKEGDWIARDFRFHTGETMPELRVHYTTIGDPGNDAVLVMHGTGGAGGNFLGKDYAGELFGPGQPLDAAKYFIVLPDSIGAGRSSKPSDGARMRFPRYNYDDMVDAQYRLMTEGLGVKHARLVMGNSMGGMETWVFGERRPDFMDALAPMASSPVEMSARNWMMRRMLIESIKADPAWNNGDYAAQPKALKLAGVWFGIGTSGGTRALRQMASTREAADKLVDERLAGPAGGDANDTIYQYEASRDYDPAPRLGDIRAALLAVNSADDERNPVELNLMDDALKRVPGARLYLIPASAETRGHGTTGMARLWKEPFAEFLRDAPRR